MPTLAPDAPTLIKKGRVVIVVPLSFFVPVRKLQVAKKDIQQSALLSGRLLNPPTKCRVAINFREREARVCA